MGLFEVFTNRQTWRDYYFGEISRDKALQKQNELIERSRHVTAPASGDIDAFRGELASLKDEIRTISYGIDAFHADYIILQGEEIWLNKLQLETQNAILQEIRIPEFEREARAYRIQAEKSYRNSFYEDALDYFLEAEKRNRQDFSVLRSIGNIYLYRLIDLPKAYEYFLKAAKYSKPYDSHLSAEAQYYAAIVCGAQQQLAKAAEHASIATELDSQFWDAFYLHAAFSAILKEVKPALTSLEAAIKGNSRYFDAAESDKMFDGIRLKVDVLLARLSQQIQREVADATQHLKQAIDTARRVGAADESSAASDVVNQLEAATKRANYSDLLATLLRVRALHGQTFNVAEQALSKRIEEKKKAIRHSENNYRAQLSGLVSTLNTLNRDTHKFSGGEFALYLIFYVILFVALFLGSCFGITVITKPTLDSRGAVLSNAFWIAVIGPIVIIAGVEFLRYIFTDAIPSWSQQHKKNKETRRVQPLKLQLEQHFERNRRVMEKELHELESLLDKCKSKQYV